MKRKEIPESVQTKQSLQTKKRKPEHSDDDDNSDADLDVFGGRGERKGAVRELEDESEEEEDKREDLQKRREDFTKGKEAESFEQDAQDDPNEERITSFNLNEERAEGYFDESGNYFHRKDANRSKDNWLTDVSREDIQKAKLAKERIDKQRVESSVIPLQVVFGELILFMEPGESVLTTLKRYSPRKNHKQAKRKTKTREIENSNDQNSSKTVERITELCLNHPVSIYQETFESIRGKCNCQYEYKWKEDGEVYGPFALNQILEWREQGYFQNEIFIRVVGSEREFIRQ